MRSRHLMRREERLCSSIEVSGSWLFDLMVIRKEAVSNCSWENVNEAELDLPRLNKITLFRDAKGHPPDRRLDAVIEIFIRESYRERRYYRERPFMRRGKTAKRIEVVFYS